MTIGRKYPSVNKQSASNQADKTKVLQVLASGNALSDLVDSLLMEGKLRVGCPHLSLVFKGRIVMNRVGPPAREIASTSYSSVSANHHRLHVDNVRVGRKFSAPYNGRMSNGSPITQAFTQQERCLSENGQRVGDAAQRPVKRQVMEKISDIPAYVPLSQAQEIISEAVDASSPPPPKLLRFCESGQQVILTKQHTS